MLADYLARPQAEANDPAGQADVVNEYWLSQGVSIAKPEIAEQRVRLHFPILLL